MKAPDHCGGRRIRCPNCAGELTLPKPPPADEIIDAEIVEEPTPSNPWEVKFLDDLHQPAQVQEYLEPPIVDAELVPSPAPPRPARRRGGDWLKRMFEAALDPRSIHWLLTLGGGLMVLGGIIWMVSQGVLENPVVLALVLGAASLGVLVGGWFVTLKTRFKIAGRALTFLGCVVVPLNLWFYDSQNLLALEQGLWIGGVACVLLYAVTVWVLRDPLFMYAVEAGVTLTAVLLLGSFGLADQATHLSLLLMALALISIHAPKAFPQQDAEFTEQRFGLPLFWCGHAQLAAALLVLLGTQTAHWMLDQVGNIFRLPAAGIPLTTTAWVPGLLWLAGAYAYLYSDFVVRRIGVYLYLAALCLVMGEITLIGFDTLGIEGLIATLAATATGVSLLTLVVGREDDRFARAIPPLALILSLLPVLLGLGLHLRSTSMIAAELDLARQTGWTFALVMLAVAALNRVSAWVYQPRSSTLSAVYLFFTAGSLIVAAAALLRVMGVATWHQQLAWLMLLPIGYIVAARLWRGQPPERPLGWIAHTATAVLLAHALLGACVMLTRGFQHAVHLPIALLLAETAVFYTLAAVFRRQSANLYFATAAGCGAVWQLMLYVHLPQELFTTIFAVAGLALLIAARQLGLEQAEVYDAAGNPRTVRRGRGTRVMQAGQAILTIALAVAFFKGVLQLAAVGLTDREFSRFDWISLAVLTATAIAGAAVSPREGPWRRGYTVAAVGMAGLTFVSLSVAVDLNIWRKLEIFLVAVGLVMLAAGYVGRFKEEADRNPNEMTSLGLWLGSIFASLPVIFAVFYQWNTVEAFSPVDEIALLTVTLLMLATGVVWQVKASTVFGGGTLSVYLVVLVISLLYRPNAGIGLYLAIGGGTLFGIGLLLALYRDRLISLPQRIAEREGIFRVISWR